MTPTYTWKLNSLHINLLSSEQCSQFERFRLQHVQMVNKTSSFKTKCIGNNAEASRVNRNTLWCLTVQRSTQQADIPLQIIALPIIGRGADTLFFVLCTDDLHVVIVVTKNKERWLWFDTIHNAELHCLSSQQRLHDSFTSCRHSEAVWEEVLLFHRVHVWGRSVRDGARVHAVSVSVRLTFRRYRQRCWDGDGSS